MHSVHTWLKELSNYLGLFGPISNLPVYSADVLCFAWANQGWLRLCRGKADHLGSAPIDWWTTTVHERDGSAKCWPFTGVVLGCGENVTGSAEYLGTHWGDWRPLWSFDLVAVKLFCSANTLILFKVYRAIQSVSLPCMLIRQSIPGGSLWSAAPSTLWPWMSPLPSRCQIPRDRSEFRLCWH